MVRLIHTADLHLDAAFSSRFTKEEAEERRQKLLRAWSRLLDFAKEKQVQAVLISGDLFDSAVVSRTAMDFFLSSVRKNPEISFFYLRGNHDTKSTFRFQENLPKNLFLFSKEGKKYRLKEHLLLSGVELYGESGDSHTDVEGEKNFLRFKEEDFNILMLHGTAVPYEFMEGSGEGGEKLPVEGDRISLKALSAYPIDYLALGHIHKREEGRVGSMRYAYPGCLVGRGFDEEGEKGFLYLEIEEERKECRRTFVPLQEGRFRILTLELTEEEDTLSTLDRIEAELSAEEAEEQDSLRIILRGERSPEGERNLRYLENQLKERFSYVEIKEECRLVLRQEEYREEKSLKGEFLRRVMGSENLSEEEKEKIVLLGIGLLQGEEL